MCGTSEKVNFNNGNWASYAVNDFQDIHSKYTKNSSGMVDDRQTYQIYFVGDPDPNQPDNLIMLHHLKLRICRKTANFLRLCRYEIYW